MDKDKKGIGHMTTENVENASNVTSNVASVVTTPVQPQYLFTLQVRFSVVDDPEARLFAQGLVRDLPETVKLMGQDVVVTKLQEIKKNEPPRKVEIM